MSVKAIPALGVELVKPAANLPQTQTSTLFTVTGLVIVNLLVGLVTTPIGATAMTFEVGCAAASASFFGSSSALPSAPAGTVITVSGQTMTVGTGGSLSLPALGGIGVLMSGTTITWTTTANNTGQIQWTAWYAPISAGASLS